METNESPTLPTEERLEPEQLPDAESQSEEQPSEETITLCVAFYADDGFTATLMDRYGNAAEMPIPPEAFFNGERLPEGESFDIPLANCPEDLIAAYRKTRAEESVSTPSGSSNAYVIRRETCMAKRPLDETERERVGEQMARALKRKEDLESELDTARKSYNASIKEAEKDAMRAAREWEAGSREYEVLCDVVADYDKEELVWTETEEPYHEVMRRPMTAEEKQFPLPSFYPQVGGQAPVDPLGESKRGAAFPANATRPAGKRLRNFANNAGSTTRRPRTISGRPARPVRHASTPPARSLCRPAPAAGTTPTKRTGAMPTTGGGRIPAAPAARRRKISAKRRAWRADQTHGEKTALPADADGQDLRVSRQRRRDRL